jgi:hypothetical protein
MLTEMSGGIEHITTRQTQKNPMKKLLAPILAGLLATTFLTGCLNLQLGGGTKSESQQPTVGRQLIDLQKAKDSGAISDAEYQAQKATLLGNK